jgi:hypothetical protein
VQISFTSKGDFSRTEKFLRKVISGDLFRSLSGYGKAGVAALSSATPVDSGVTAASWGYRVDISQDGARITWTNDHTAGGTPVVIMLQYGHGTGTGGYVQGRDFINPAIKPVMDKVADAVWKEVVSA